VPHVDAIEYTLLRNRSTAILAFVAGKYELTFAGTLTVHVKRLRARQDPAQKVQEATVPRYRS